MRGVARGHAEIPGGTWDTQGMWDTGAYQLPVRPKAWTKAIKHVGYPGVHGYVGARVRTSSLVLSSGVWTLCPPDRALSRSWLARTTRPSSTPSWLDCRGLLGPAAAFRARNFPIGAPAFVPETPSSCEAICLPFHDSESFLRIHLTLSMTSCSLIRKAAVTPYRCAWNESSSDKACRRLSPPPHFPHSFEVQARVHECIH